MKCDWERQATRVVTALAGGTSCASEVPDFRVPGRITRE